MGLTDELKIQENLARQMVRKMETDGAIPKMTTCTIKADASGDLAVIRIIVKRLPIENVHPVSRIFLVPMAIHRIRYAVKTHSGVDDKVLTTVVADPDVFPAGEGEIGNRLLIQNPSVSGVLRQGNLRALNQELEDGETTPNNAYVRNFARLVEIVDEQVRAAFGAEVSQAR